MADFKDANFRNIECKLYVTINALKSADDGTEVCVMDLLAEVVHWNRLPEMRLLKRVSVI